MNLLLEQIQKGENQTTEFKTTFQKEVIESVVAFANTMGGKVFIDVKEYPIKPISYKNRYCLRKANSNHLMNMEEIANEYLKTKNSSWDYYVDSTQSFNDISLEKVNSFIDSISLNSDILTEVEELILFVRKHLMVEYMMFFTEFFNPGDLYDGLTIDELEAKLDIGVNVGVNSIYEFIKSNQPVNTNTIAQKFSDVTKRTIERWIKELKADKK